MADGPFCGPMDKYYRHSRSLYSTPGEEERKSTETFDWNNSFGNRKPDSYQNIFVKSRQRQFNTLLHRIETSDDRNRFEVGVKVLHSHYSFWLKFYMYDAVSAEHDYPIARSFGKIYTPTVELIVSFPNQVMLSQRRPPGEIRLDHYAATDQAGYDFPSETYAYTALTPYVMQFDKEVNFESFWIRLHRSPVVYLERAQGTRTVRVYKQGELAAETSFLLRSDEWYLIKPSGSGGVIGDTLMISERTDIDSIIVSWGDNI